MSFFKNGIIMREIEKKMCASGIRIMIILKYEATARFPLYPDKKEGHYRYLTWPDIVLRLPFSEKICKESVTIYLGGANSKMLSQIPPEYMDFVKGPVPYSWWEDVMQLCIDDGLICHKELPINGEMKHCFKITDKGINEIIGI